MRADIGHGLPPSRLPAVTARPSRRRGGRGSRRGTGPPRAGTPRAFLSTALPGVPAEQPRGRELAELVADHVLGHVHRDELVPVVHGERVAHEVRRCTVLARDQVLITRFSFRLFIAATFLSRLSWTYGPFFRLLAIDEL